MEGEDVRKKNKEIMNFQLITAVSCAITAGCVFTMAIAVFAEEFKRWRRNRSEKKWRQQVSNSTREQAAKRSGASEKRA
jgi:hypothetical protein